MWILTQPLQSRSMYWYPHFEDAEIVFASIKTSFPPRIHENYTLHALYTAMYIKSRQVMFYCLFLQYSSIYLSIRERVSRERDREGENLKADSVASMEPDTGLDLMRLWSELKPSFGCSTNEPPRHSCLFV